MNAGGSSASWSGSPNAWAASWSGYSYAGYARDLIARREKLTASISEVQGQLIVAREALAESFGEVKRYEIAAANRQKRDRLAVERRQRIAQDEVALQVYRRRNDGRR